MHPIVVAGAGIGGLSAALALAERGFEVEVYERAPDIHEIGAGLQLGPNAFSVFQALGIEAAMERIAFAPKMIRFRDSASGRDIFKQNLGESFIRRFGQPYRVAFRADVQRELLKAVEHQKRCTIHTGEGIVGFVHRERGVEVATDRGHCILGAALIGADGIWSEIRKSLIGDGPPLTQGHLAYRAVVPVQGLREGLATDDVQIFVGPGHHLVCYKLRRGELINVVAVIESNVAHEGWEERPDLALLHHSFARACAPLQALLPLLSDSRVWVLRDRLPAKGWSVGAATLLGDAAHPTLPYLAQGACMAIEDALCVAAQFAQQPADLSSACLEYERARYDRTARIQSVAREMGRLNHLSGEAAQARDEMLQGRDPDDHEGNAWIFDGPQTALSAEPANFFGDGVG